MTTKELLEQVKARIMADPGSYMQTSFCGTQCCIAGHIDVLVNGAEFHNSRLTRQTFALAVEEIEKVANEALGEDESPWLFGTINTDEDENNADYEQPVEYWPLDLCLEYVSKHTPAERAAVGCKAIDLYIEERGL
jgi:hypothetical protein